MLNSFCGDWHDNKTAVNKYSTLSDHQNALGMKEQVSTQFYRGENGRILLEPNFRNPVA